MIITSIDPGLKNTGIVMFRFHGEKFLGEYITTLKDPNLYSLLEKMARFSKEIVIERMPSNLEYPLYGIVSQIENIFKDSKVTFISPATWKPISKARGWNPSDAKTQHERDAFCMLIYYLLFYKEIIVNENYA